MVKKADFKYDQQTEKMLKNLKEMAEFEGYLTDASKEFEALEKKLRISSALPRIIAVGIPAAAADFCSVRQLQRP